MVPRPTPGSRRPRVFCEGANGCLRSSLVGEHRRDHGSQKWVFWEASLGEALELKHKLEYTVKMSTKPNPQCFFSPQGP